MKKTVLMINEDSLLVSIRILGLGQLIVIQTDLTLIGLI